MKKILAGLLIGASIASSIYAYDQPEISGDLDAAGSGWKLTFEEYIIENDDDGNPAIALIYNFTNNSNSPLSAGSRVSFENYQNGRSLDTTWLPHESDYRELSSNTTEKIKDGVTLPVIFCFELRDMSGDVEIGMSVHESRSQKNAIISLSNAEINGTSEDVENNNALSNHSDDHYDYQEYENRINELMAEAETLKSDLEEITNEKESITQKYNSLDTEFTELKRSFETLQTAYDKQKEELEQTKEELRQSQERIEALSTAEVTEVPAQVDDNQPETNSHTEYHSGQYIVGKDIPTGKYVLFASESGRSGYLFESRDANQDDIVQSARFDYETIAEITEGNYLELSHACAIPLDEDPAIDITRPGTFLVGKHISAGEYMIEQIDSEYGAYYFLYTDFTKDNFAGSDRFDGIRYVTVTDGQLLELSNARIVTE